MYFSLVKSTFCFISGTRLFYTVQREIKYFQSKREDYSPKGEGQVDAPNFLKIKFVTKVMIDVFTGHVSLYLNIPLWEKKPCLRDHSI